MKNGKGTKSQTDSFRLRPLRFLLLHLLRTFVCPGNKLQLFVSAVIFVTISRFSPSTLPHILPFDSGCGETLGIRGTAQFQRMIITRDTMQSHLLTNLGHAMPLSKMQSPSMKHRNKELQSAKALTVQLETVICGEEVTCEMKLSPAIAY
eukprot:3340860-Amphidinium_carterae.1